MRRTLRDRAAAGRAAAALRGRGCRRRRRRARAGQRARGRADRAAHGSRAVSPASCGRCRASRCSPPMPFSIALRTSDPAAVRTALVCKSYTGACPRYASGIQGHPVAVLTGDDRGRGEATGVAASRLKLILIASIFGGMALIVMAILVASIISLAVEQRHRGSRCCGRSGRRRQVQRLVVRRQCVHASPRSPAASPGPCWRRSCSRFQDGGIVRACSRCATCSRWSCARWRPLLVVRMAAARRAARGPRRR